MFNNTIAKDHTAYRKCVATLLCKCQRFIDRDIDQWRRR